MKKDKNLQLFWLGLELDPIIDRYIYIYIYSG